ncbi:unnamed protein product [Mycena citricolor]|uniref:Mitochondrial carrier n=1 Tax=Mycena citricolor TaxID=2018698 RepID=A0AAD2HL79_9AGAR|nr:unnamed protein product [Mycena citricolor]
MAETPLECLRDALNLQSLILSDPKFFRTGPPPDHVTGDKCLSTSSLAFSTSAVAGMAQQVPSFFSKPAYDHAVAGIGAGTVAVLCMNPLDLLKVKFQVSRSNPAGGIGKQIWFSLRDIQRQEGWKGLYRGLGPNIAGNASSWGLYFLFYNMLKKRAADNNPNPAAPLSSGSILLCSAQASAVTAIMTNPIWVVKVRMFTTTAGAPDAYRGVFHGLTSIFRTEGVQGLFRGTTLALVGVSNGAIQFMVYERMKRWGFELKKRQFELSGKKWTTDADKLSNTAYSVMSGGSKIAALALTYPYQVVRSRIQVRPDSS